MEANYFLIIISGLVIFSYLFDVFAKKTKIPAVLLLLFTGIGLHYLTLSLNIAPPDFSKILPALGTIGLIMIVLEGALELKYEKSKIQIIRKAFFAALFILVTTAVAISYLFHFTTHEPFNICLLNAIPYSIISSAIAIPSVANISKQKREFVIYESSFSDILGIMLFNFALNNETISAMSFLTLGIDTVSVLLISVAFCLLLMYILGRITHHIKFFLIISILLLVYAIGKHFHLSALVIVLAFGLFLSNAEKLNFNWFKKHLMYDKFSSDLHQLLQISAESAFILRTFFFIIFGFTMILSSIMGVEIQLTGLIVLGIIYSIRLIYLKFIANTDLIPELFITPRGLISILLFYNIPEHLQIAQLGSGLLFLVILATSIMMTVGLLGARKPID